MKLLIVGFIALAMIFNLVCAGVEPLLPAEEIPDVAVTTAASSTESVLPEKSSSTTEMAKVDAETSKTGQEINKLLDAEHEESTGESSTKTVRSVIMPATYKSVPPQTKFKRAFVEQSGSRCSCYCEPPPPPTPCSHSHTESNALPKSPSKVPIAPKSTSQLRTADDEDDNKNELEDSLTDEARDRSALLPAEQPSYGASYPAYPPQPQYYQQSYAPASAPAPAYTPPQPSYPAPQPSYAPLPKPAYQPPKQPAYAPIAPSHYHAQQYTYPSAAPQAQCGENLLVNCEPTVAQVPCSANNAPAAY